MQDEEIICIALLKVKLLDQLNTPDIRVLAQFFNIPQKGIYQQTLMQLKKSIAYIILIQRYDLQEYLCLSKFKRLPSHLQQILHMYFRTVRDCFQNQKRGIQGENLKNFQKTQTGIEKLSTLMRNTLPKVTNPKEKTQVGFNRYNFFNQYNQNVSQSRLNYSVPSMPSYLFPYQNYVNNNIFQNYSNRNNFMNNIMLDRSKQQDVAIQITQKVDPHAKIDNQNFKQEYISDNNIQSEEVQVPATSDSKKFHCFCGKKMEDSIVRCKQCSKEFHSKCWIPFSSSSGESVCPFCKLIYKHCYTKIVGEAIMERSEEVRQKLSSVKKINLSSGQIQQLTQAIKICQDSQNTWLQIRMLRVQPLSQGQSRGMKSCFAIPVSEGKKLINRKWLQMKLTNIGEGGYLLVCLVCVTPIQFQHFQKQILQLKSQVENANLPRKKYSSPQLQNIKINFKHPITKRLITIPVRGDRCDHPECQDLKYVYEMGSSRQSRIICSFCHKEYSVFEYFHFDPIIAQKLKQYSKLPENARRMLDLSQNCQQNISPKQNEKQKQSQNLMVDEKEEGGEHNFKQQNDKVYQKGE